jgi:hypothetical protein
MITLPKIKKSLILIENVSNKWNLIMIIDSFFIINDNTWKLNWLFDDCEETYNLWTLHF